MWHPRFKTFRRKELARNPDRVARYEAQSAVLVIYRDTFKDVDDAFDRKAGDDLLEGVAGALRHGLRPTVVLAWVGGEELAVLLPEADAGEARNGGAIRPHTELTAVSLARRSP